MRLCEFTCTWLSSPCFPVCVFVHARATFPLKPSVDAEIPKEEKDKYQEEFENFQQELDKKKEEFQKEHPDVQGEPS